MKMNSGDLLQKCADAMGAGADFPTVWQTVLRQHPLVLGPPVQYMDGECAQLHIRLITGQRLVFDSVSKQFSIR